MKCEWRMNSSRERFSIVFFFLPTDVAKASWTGKSYKSIRGFIQVGITWITRLRCLYILLIRWTTARLSHLPSNLHSSNGSSETHLGTHWRTSLQVQPPQLWKRFHEAFRVDQPREPVSSTRPTAASVSTLRNVISCVLYLITLLNF